MFEAIVQVPILGDTILSNVVSWVGPVLFNPLRLQWHWLEQNYNSRTWVIGKQGLHSSLWVVV